jgi:hypothetical protein
MAVFVKSLGFKPLALVGLGLAAMVSLSGCIIYVEDNINSDAPPPPPPSSQTI